MPEEAKIQEQSQNSSVNQEDVLEQSDVEIQIENLNAQA